MPTFESMQKGYKALWDNCTVTRKSAADTVASKIIANKDKYKKVEQYTNVPWYMVGVLHNRESGMDFARHLHNGDPLTEKTVRVPEGRPPGRPPFTWEDSAIDALTMEGHKLHEITDWTIERVLYECEKYNGWGYTRHEINSPYLWAGTDRYISGKYIADGEFSATAVDKQLGVVCVLKSIFAKTGEEIKGSSVPSSNTVKATGAGGVVAASSLGAYEFSDYAIYIIIAGLILAGLAWWAIPKKG